MPEGEQEKKNNLASQIERAAFQRFRISKFSANGILNECQLLLKDLKLDYVSKMQNKKKKKVTKKTDLNNEYFQLLAMN